MKKIFIAILFLISVQSFGQTSGYTLYAIRKNTNGSIDSIDRKFSTDSLFLRTGLTFFCYTKEYYSQFYQPVIPNGFANYVLRGDGIWVNQNFSSDNCTIVPSTIQTALDGKAALSHSHSEADVTNLVSDLAGKASSSHTHTYASLTSIPSTFTPSAHTHAESEVTNLVTDLAGKASSVHTHAISDVTNLQTSLNALAPLNSPTLVTPNIGAATGTSLAVSGNITSSGGGIGYVTGNGGTVAQTGNKGTAVTINKLSGRITLVNSALAAGAEVSFNVNNSTVGANDIVSICMIGGGTVGAYSIGVTALGAGVFTVTISNLSTGSLSEALQLNFYVFKGSVN